MKPSKLPSTTMKLFTMTAAKFDLTILMFCFYSCAFRKTLVSCSHQTLLELAVPPFAAKDGTPYLLMVSLGCLPICWTLDCSVRPCLVGNVDFVVDGCATIVGPHRLHHCHLSPAFVPWWVSLCCLTSLIRGSRQWRMESHQVPEARTSPNAWDWPWISGSQLRGRRPQWNVVRRSSSKTKQIFLPMAVAPRYPLSPKGSFELIGHHLSALKS